jgi:plasmid stability protein
MRIILNLDAEIMRRLKGRAAETGRTMTSLVEDALCSMLEREARPPSDHRLTWRIVEGGVRPDIDLSDRNALMDLMDGRG